MERKARENLEAAQVLLDLEDPCPNAAASRAYYAAYHACWTALVDAGIPVDERGGRRYFVHNELPDRCSDARVLEDEGQQRLSLLLDLRVRADYYEDDVTVQEARDGVAEALALVSSLLGDERSM